MQTMTPLEVPQRWEQLRQLVIDNFNDSQVTTAEISQLFEHLDIYHLVKSRESVGTDQYLDHQEMLTRFRMTKHERFYV